MKLSSRGRVTIPKDIRDRCGLVPGTKVDFVERPDGLHMVKQPPSRSERYKGYLADRWVFGDTDEYLRESRGR